jgi:hypothetical protein
LCHLRVAIEASYHAPQEKALGEGEKL